MAGKQRVFLEETARDVLSGMGMHDVRVAEPRIGRPPAARLEIVHPVLDGYPRSEWWEQMKRLRPDSSAPVVTLEIAQMTRLLREAGIRATADYGLGVIVVGWGAPPNADISEIRHSLASRSGGGAVSDADALIAWAAHPGSEVDGMTPALQDAIEAIHPACR